MSVAVWPKGWNCGAGRARLRFCPSEVQVNSEWEGGLVSSGPLTDWTGGAPHCRSRAVSSSSSINGSSGSSINGDSNFVHFCNQLHEGVEFTPGGGRCGRPNCLLWPMAMCSHSCVRQELACYCSRPNCMLGMFT